MVNQTGEATITGVLSASQGFKLELPETPRTSRNSTVLKGLRGALNWSPNIPRGASILDRAPCFRPTCFHSKFFVQSISSNPITIGYLRLG